MDSAVLSLRGISKSYGSSRVLNGLSLDVCRGEFVTLLGESGCGKTTTLRAVAGLEKIDGGDILLDGASVKDLPPDKRNVNTVFQNYALFPHMNVFDNIAYGPRIRGISKQEIRSAAAEMLELVKMTGYEKRMPHQLSGGQRQRVAIARALVNKPLLLLLDEPLGALDLKLRQHMQTELKGIQTKAGVTFIYVTHDQEEALNMSDKIAVMRAGVLEQTGPPRDIYENPETLFVAEFVGDRNIFPVSVTEQTDGYTKVSAGGEMFLARKNPSLKPGDAVRAAIHTDRMSFAGEGGTPCGVNRIGVRITDSVYAGYRIKSVVEAMGGVELNIVEYLNEPGGGARAKGRSVLSFSAADVVLV